MPVNNLDVRDLNHVLDKTRHIWEEARGKNIFITGGTGFFGFWLIETFVYINQSLNLGITAYILSRDPGSFCLKAPHLALRKDIKFIQGDVRTFETSDISFYYLIHAATQASAKLDIEAPDEMYEVIIKGTSHIIDLCKKSSVKKILFISSGAIYGQHAAQLGKITEDYTPFNESLNNLSAYARGKREAERLLQDYASTHDVELKIARCFAFVGPHLPLNTHFAVGNFIRDAIASKPILIHGDGSPMRSYLYTSDLAIWLWTILFQGSSGRAYNVGSDEAISILDLANLIRETISSSSEVTVLTPSNGNTVSSFYVPSTQRAQNELGLLNYVSLKEAIRLTAQWYNNT